MSLLSHVQAILALPVMVTIVIPGVIILTTQSVNIGWSLPAPINGLPLLIGALLIGLGLLLIVKTVALFATVGQGTLAPWSATRILVVQGVYRYVRNPMISGVGAILLGEAVLLGSRSLLTWFGLGALVNLIYIPFIEEVGLEQRFGSAYSDYKRHVPRWIPRRTPWTGG
ncbi:MAG TPA: isoprenylcysteine carboxylmethyltransferase family protein [Anaerolineae bacterium]|nr:isoprenylcysteine carboxylmethyltransferase family protein [Anaerolineae bacterium]